MERDAVIGMLLLFSSIGFIILLTVWSRGTIEFIARNKLHSIREIMKALDER